MMNRIVLGVSLVCGAYGCTGGGGTETPKDAPRTAAAPAAPGALDAAHKAYLDGDFIAVTERIRDVLLDPSSGELAKENAYELLDKAYEVQGGKLPSVFKPPPDSSGSTSRAVAR
jgi:hypothetical protein